MKYKTKKRLISALSFAIVLSMNISPIAGIAGAIAESGFVDRLGNLKDNLIYLAENDWSFNSYADNTATESTTTSSSCSCSFSCDAESAIDTLMGTGDIDLTDINTALSGIKGDTSNLGGIKTSVDTIKTNTGDILEALGEDGVIYGKLKDIETNTEDIEILLKDTNKLLGEIKAEIQEMQHEYRVAHIYSLNNSWDNALWRPHTEDCPYIEDIATVHGKFANVYSGYWNTAVTPVQYETATKVNELGQTVLDEELLRAYEVLGYDIIRRYEGAVTGPVAIVKCEDKLQTYSEFLNNYTFEKYTKDDGTIGYKYYKLDENGNPGTQVSAQFEVPLVYYFEDIDKEKVTWLDAITVLYKALGEEEVHYTSHMVRDTTITPETSPVSQGLSGITQFEGYNYLVFQTRANPIKQAQEVKNEQTGQMELKYTIEYTYWDRAKVDGFITQGTNMTDPITFDRFCMLAEDMMTAFGEPTIGQDEMKALLQVYGSQFPIQLGTDVADAWAYMMVRGILVDPTINYTDTLTRAELLKMAAAIKDDSFRTDFKNIQITLDLSDVMQEDGYYPVEDFSFTQGQFSSSKVYNYEVSNTYEYLIPKESNAVLTSPTVYTLSASSLADINTLVSNSSFDLKSKELNGATYLTTVTLEDVEYYVVSVPKSFTGNIWVGNSASEFNYTEDLNKWYCIPSNCLGGGIFLTTSVTIESTGTIVTIKPDGCMSFDTQSNNYSLISYTDYLRAGLNERPSATQVAYGLTTYEKMLAYADIYTKPLTVHADTEEELESTWVKYTIKNSEISLDGSNSEAVKMSTQGGTVLNVEPFSDKLKFSNVPDSLKSEEYAIDWGRTEPSFNPDHCDKRWSYANNDQLKVLYRMGTLTDFGVNQFIETSSPKDILKAYLKGVGTSDVPYLVGQELKVINTTGDLQVNSVYTVYTNTWNYDELTKADAGLFPYMFLTAGRPIKYMAIQNSGSHSVLGIKDESRTFSINDKLIIGAEDSDLNKLLKDNMNVMYTDAEDDLISKWIQVYDTRYVDYGQTIYNLDNVAQGCSEYIGNTFWVNTKNPEAILSDLGSLESQYKDGIQGYGTTENTYSLNANVASSAIMNRSQQVLVSWDDLIKCDFIVGNNGNVKPEPNPDGSYSFMTKNGQVIVNDINKTIQIGTILYDLYYEGEESPTLVYYDSEQDMIYFDYRCILGVVSEKFQRTGTTTEFLDNCIGAGKYVVYDLSDGNVTSKTYDSLDIVAKNLTSVSTYHIRVANSIDEFDGKETSMKNVYGEALAYTGRRMTAASFIPTANWVTCIDDDGIEVSGAVYVYYPSVAFTEGFINSSGTGIEKPNLVPIKDRWKDFVNVVDSANMIQPKDGKSSLKEALKNAYGKDVSELSIDNDADLPLIMTYYSIAKLYEKTGVYYFDSAWYVREFDITNNTWYQASTNNNITASQNADGNSVGIMYWVDSVGYVYNVPKMGEFTWAKYFNGDIMLPLVANKEPAEEIINLNLDYYGSSNQKDGSSQKLYYGTYITNDGFKYVQCDSNGITDIDATITSLTADKLKGKDADTNPDSDVLDTPMKVGNDVTTYIVDGNGAVVESVFIPAPSGIYVAFGQNTFETWVVSKLSSYIVDANYVYYGNTQLTLQPKSINDSTTGFKFSGATTWNAFTIPNSTIMYRVHKTNTVSTLIITPSSLQSASASGIDTVEIDDLSTNPIEDWLSKIGANSLLQSIDEGASWLIVITFNVLPIIGIILMTILVGLAFLAENQLVQMFCDKIIDPVKIMTFGRRDIHRWNWRKVLVPCIIMYCVFALFLNGNLIMIVQALAEWYGVISEWIGQVL